MIQCDREVGGNTVKEKAVQEWLNAAVSGIGFWLDREKVEEELRGHLEDKTADLERIFHLSHEEAEEMALKQMGDPKEIGEDLARIHKAWLGWLWLLSQVTVIALLCLAVLVWSRDPGGQWENLKRDLLGTEYTDSAMFDPWRWVDRESCQGLQVLELSCPETQAGQYRVEVEQTQLWRYEEVEGREGDLCMVYVRFRTEQKRPWESPINLSDKMWAEDDCGTYIMSHDENLYREGPREWAEHMISEHIARKPFENMYQVIAVGVSPEATELTLYYDELGAEFALSISLEGELVE